MSLYIVFGSETGNAEGFAQKTAEKFGGSAIPADSLDLASLQSGDVVLVHMSTWGDGDAPSNAGDFHSNLMSQSYNFSGVKYSVFAIGSTGFAQFCQAGMDIDGAFQKHGAESLAPIKISDDGSYDSDYNDWISSISL